MKTIAMKRVTIVADNALQRVIVKELSGLGATGYTYTVVHGEGAKGIRPSRWEGPNAKIEVIGTLEVVHRILEHVSKNYFERYAVIVFLDDVEVLRGSKFGAKTARSFQRIPTGIAFHRNAGRHESILMQEAAPGAFDEARIGSGSFPFLTVYHLQKSSGKQVNQRL